MAQASFLLPLCKSLGLSRLGDDGKTLQAIFDPHQLRAGKLSGVDHARFFHFRPSDPRRTQAVATSHYDQYQELLRLGMPVVHTDAGDRHSKADVDRWFGVVPPGAPKWITPDDIEETIRVWQPSYRQLLSADDALEILINTRNLLDVLFPPK